MLQLRLLSAESTTIHWSHPPLSGAAECLVATPGSRWLRREIAKRPLCSLRAMCQGKVPMCSAPARGGWSSKPPGPSRICTPSRRARGFQAHGGVPNSDGPSMSRMTSAAKTPATGSKTPSPLRPLVRRRSGGEGGLPQPHARDSGLTLDACWTQGGPCPGRKHLLSTGPVCHYVPMVVFQSWA